MSRLNQVHKGYNYQDLVTACVFASSLLTRPKEITVDYKKFPEDIFDDLRLKLDGKQEAYQFKFSEDPATTFSLVDLKTTKRDLRIDHVINSFALDPDRSQTSYFIITTLLVPEDELLDILILTPELTSFGGITYRLDPEKLWPKGGEFKWKLKDAADIQQKDLYELSEKLRLVFGASRPSFDLRNPGAQENKLFSFLKSEVGIGYYPNQDKNAFDIASALLNFATRARQNTTPVTADLISQYIQLRMDFGKISQEFPVDPEKLIERKAFLDEFIEFIQARRVSILVGAPGAGKSWFIDGVISTLRKNEIPIIHHYCYVSPFDVNVSSRINQNVLYGNLVSELLKIAPHLQEQHRPFYSATRESFEMLLKRASEELDDVYIVVDGLDHITRVLHQHPEISSTEAKILDDLSTLSLPENVHLILSAQPGPHISFVASQDNTIEMPPWRKDDVSKLLKCSLPPLAIADSNWDEVVKVFHEKSAGSPLYLTYLINDFSESFKKDCSLKIERFLESKITLNGNIATYYDHLFATAQRQGTTEASARLLGLVEFALTEKDIAEILGPIAAPPSVVEKCLNILRPVLTYFESQGGYRIYHESFRRFIFDKLTSGQIELKDALAPIIQWLEKKEFYRDTLAFRYLIILLMRSGRRSEALNKIQIDFVALALQYGHCYHSIDSNLISAMDACDKIDSLPKMITLWELRRSLHEVFEGKLLDTDLRKKYEICLGTFLGWEFLRDSLLYEGVPVLDKKNGLLACRVCDENGVVPPWREYLSLSDEPAKHAHHEQDLDTEISNFVGRCRTNPQILDRLRDFLAKNPDTDISYLQQIISHASRIFGYDIISEVIESAVGISQVHKAISYITLAQELKKSGDANGFQSIELKLIELCADQSYSQELISLGLDLKKFSIQGDDITQFNIGLSGDLHSLDDVCFEKWLNAIIVASFQKPQEVEAYLSTISQNSWYRCWLHFVGRLFLAISDPSLNDITRAEKILNELSSLSSFDQPFVGLPRACDIYNIHKFTLWSFRLALSNLQATGIVTRAIESLILISNNSTTSLQGCPGGPLVHSELLDIALDTIKNRSLMTEVSPLLSTLISDNENGGYYGILADHQFLLARLRFLCGEDVVALEAYKKGCFYLTCYGERKDPTIYELIDSMQAISFDVDGSISVANKTLSILRAVQAHTDGKGTSTVFIRWFNEVLSMIPESALVLLGDSIGSPTGFTNWQTEDCVEIVVSELANRLDPITFNAIEMGLRVDNRFAINESRMKAVLKFLDVATLSQNEKDILVAHLIEDTHTRTSDWILRVSEKLSLHGQHCLAPQGVHHKQAEPRYEYGAAEDERSRQLYQAMMRGKSARTLRAELRKVQSTYINEDSLSEDFVNAIGYRLCELLGKGEISEYREMVQCLDEELSFSSRARFWEYLADGLWRLGFNNEAAEVYVISHCRSRGDGWLAMGGDDSRFLLVRAISIAPEVATLKYLELLKCISKGVAYAFGFSRHVIEDLAAMRKKVSARESWESAYDIISKRLPSTYVSFGPFLSGLEKVMPGDLDSAIIYLICCRLNDAERRRKMSAVVAISQLVEKAPRRLIQPLKRLMTFNSTSLTLAIILRIIEEYELAPYSISCALQNELLILLGIDHFFISDTSRLLLNRIGVSAPDIKVPVIEKQLVMQPDPRFMNFFDWGRRLALIHESIPNLTSALMYELTKAVNSKIFQDTLKDRVKYYHSRGHADMPMTPSVDWKKEEFDHLLNQLLARHFFGTAQTSLRETIRSTLMPRINELVEHWNSRMLRSDHPFPDQMKDGDEKDVQLMVEGELKDWIVLGRAEEQLNSGKNHFSFTGATIACHGVIFHDGIVPPEIPPLGDDSSLISADFEESDIIIGPISACHIRHEESFWGPITTIVLDPRVVKRMGLTEQSKTGKMRYLNENKECVCKFVTWSSWFVGSDIGGECPFLRGGMLIARPSFWNELKDNLAKIFLARTRISTFSKSELS